MNGNEVRIGDPGPLTPREAEALLWIAEGKTAWEAGTILGVTESTLNAHALNAAAKLHASNRAHLVTRAFVLGILRPVMRAFIAFIIAQGIYYRPDDSWRTPRGRRREDEISLVVYERHSGGISA